MGLELRDLAFVFISCIFIYLFVILMKKQELRFHMVLVAMGRFSLCSDRFCFTEHSVTHHSTFLPTKAPFHSHFPISEYTLLCGFGCTGFTLLLGKSSPVLFLLGRDPAGCGRIPKLHVGTRERE